MQTLISLLEDSFAALPLPLLELWGILAFAAGALLALCAYGRLSFRPHGRWGLAMERQVWNARAFAGLVLSFLAVLAAGWMGPGTVVVENALTVKVHEDLVALLCIVLFGFPALLAVPPAFMLSDLAAGAPPEVLLAWTAGYVFRAAFLWTAYQLIGRKPDFRRLGTWGRYLLFALLMLAFEPVMWGHVCSGRFSAAISYQLVPPALFASLLLTLALAPFALLLALPLLRRAGLFWADIPGHVKVRPLGSREWRNEVLHGEGDEGREELHAVPLRAVLGASFIVLVLGVSSTVAFLMLEGGQGAVEKLSLRLHRAVLLLTDLSLDDYLAQAPAGQSPEARSAGMSAVIAAVPLQFMRAGRVFLLDEAGRVLASNKPELEPAQDPVIAAAVAALRDRRSEQDYRFIVIIARPLSRESWMARAVPYADRSGAVRGLAVAALPQSDYLAELGAGNSQAAVLSAVAVCLALLAGVALAAAVAAPTRRITRAVEAMAAGNLDQHVRPSRLSEMSILVHAFNHMAAQLQESFRRTAASENTLKSIFSASPIALAVFRTESKDGQRSMMDPERGRMVVEVNEAWERITGHRREDIVGKLSSTQLDLWARSEDRMRFVQELFEQGSVDGFEARMRRADGAEYDALISARDVLANQERLAVFAVQDVSEARRASAQLLKLNQQLGALLDAAVEVAIIATDLDCRITVFNSGAEKMLGYGEDEMLGESSLGLHLPGEIASCVAAFSILEDSGEFQPEQVYQALTRDSASIRNWTLMRKNGELLQVSMALSAVRDERGQALGYLAIARDVTEQLAAQAEMVEMNMNLDQRVRERTQAVQESKEQLQEALDKLRRMQSQLVQSEKLSGLAHIVAGVAHELNTPIGNSVTVATTLHESSKHVAREMAEGTLKKQRFGEYLGSMVDGTSLLERALRQAATLVSNFKRVSHDQGGSVLRQFDLLATVNDIVILLNPTIKKTPYKLKIDVPEGIVMESYPGALEQVITNAINNAIAHAFDGREQGTMTLKARLEDDNPERVRIEFSDDGVGMSDSTLAQIFNPFFTTALGRGGSGLGMSITYSLITGTLDGEISVSSVPGLGSQFVFRLPLKAPARAADAAEVES